MDSPRLVNSAINLVESVVQQYTGIPLSVANLSVLARAYPNEKAPSRPAFTYYNTPIDGNVSSGPSNHLNISQLFDQPTYLFFYPNGVPTYEEVNYDNPPISASASIDTTVPADGPHTPAATLAPATAPASLQLASTGNDSGFTDGSFEELGQLQRAYQAAPPTNSDPGAEALLSLFGNPAFLLSSLWDVKGTATLVEDGANTGAQLTETADTSIGQEITPNGGDVTFNVSQISAGPGDTLQVWFNNELLGSLTPAGATAGNLLGLPGRRRH